MLSPHSNIFSPILTFTTVWSCPVLLCLLHVWQQSQQTIGCISIISLSALVYLLTTTAGFWIWCISSSCCVDLFPSTLCFSPLGLTLTSTIPFLIACFASWHPFLSQRLPFCAANKRHLQFSWQIAARWHTITTNCKFTETLNSCALVCTSQDSHITLLIQPPSN